MGFLRSSVIIASLSILAGCGGAQDREAATVKSALTSPQILEQRGRAWEAHGDLTRASEYYEAAVRAGADERTLVPSLMRVYTASRRYRRAITAGERWLKQTPESVELRFLVATLLSATGEATRAKDHFEEVLKRRPRMASAHYALAVLSRDLGAPVQADAHFREYLKLEPGGRHAGEARASLLERVR
jgi:tetratricopeptide (TPR) repeat protein